MATFIRLRRVNYSGSIVTPFIEMVLKQRTVSSRHRTKCAGGAILASVQIFSCSALTFLGES